MLRLNRYFAETISPLPGISSRKRHVPRLFDTTDLSGHAVADQWVLSSDIRLSAFLLRYTS